MREKFKSGIKVKISTAINGINILSLICILLLSFVGYNRIGVLKDNVESIYNDDVHQMSKSRNIVEQVSELQLNVLKQVAYYEQSLDTEIDDCIYELNRSITGYTESLDEEQKINASKLVESLNKYVDVWYGIQYDINHGTGILPEKRALLEMHQGMVIDDLGRQNYFR
ncbi:MAG TPA: hypothetical protein DG753_07875 [Clostridium sp.]|nr:hypothetical protein [Clostridium sp.]